MIVARRFEGDVRVSYSRTEIVSKGSDVEHELVREAMRATGIPRGIDVMTLADVPSQGTGLGSSSTVTVGLLNALYAFQGIYRAPLALAEEASRIEIEVLGKPIGRQDQYASAVGGFNLIEFLRDGGGVRVEPVVMPSGCLKRLHRSLLMFYTGRQRQASTVLEEQRSAVQDGKAIASLEHMRDLAYSLRDELAAGNVDAVGRLLHENWELKKGLVEKISSPEVDRWYELGRRAGATGGKVLGAGGGGFLLLYAPPARHDAIRRELGELREVPIRLAARGTHITVMNDALD
ncbi:MAG: GHMP kinase [Solirubrobacterales bacterium]|nr:GHMP kinase [Solirubrobacterales bacterium]